MRGVAALSIAMATSLVVPQSLRAAQADETSLRTEAAGTLTFNEALRLALEYNPEIGRLEAGLAERLAAAIEAETKMNPHFKITAGPTSEGGDTGASLEPEAEQPWRPSDFGLRRTYAVALRAAANLNQQADLLRVLNQTAALYYRAWSLQERHALLTRGRDEASAVVQAIAKQLEVGQSDVSQASIFKAEEARFNAELLGVCGESAGARSELQRATGLSSGGFRLTKPAVPPLPSTASLALFAEKRASLRRIALAGRTAATQRLRVAQADAVFPIFAPGLLHSYSSVEDRNQAGITAGGRPPLWDRKQGGLTRAEGALDAAERAAAGAGPAAMRRLILLRRKQVLEIQAAAEKIRNEVLPAYRRVYDATLEQFRAGQATALQFFAMQKRLIQEEEEALQNEMQALSARTKLEQLIGGRIEEVSEEADLWQPHELIACRVLVDGGT